MLLMLNRFTHIFTSRLRPNRQNRGTFGGRRGFRAGRTPLPEKHLHLRPSENKEGREKHPTFFIFRVLPKQGVSRYDGQENTRPSSFCRSLPIGASSPKWMFFRKRYLFLGLDRDLCERQRAEQAGIVAERRHFDLKTLQIARMENSFL